MSTGLTILIVQFVLVHCLVLAVHAFRHRIGRLPFFVLIGGMTAIITWATDAGVVIQVGGLSFLVGSAVCYTSVLLGVFVVYVIDGSRATRILIASMIGMALLACVMAVLFRLQLSSPQGSGLSVITAPNLRTNVAGILSTVCASLLLAVTWQLLHNKLSRVPLVVRVLSTLFGVFCIDLLIFNGLAFWGHQQQWDIIAGAMLGRLVAAVVVSPLCSIYISYEGKRSGILDEGRPVFSILQELRTVASELDVAQGEIELRKQAEAEQRRLIEKLESALAEVKQLSGLLPICARCKKIRDGQDYWQQLEAYFRTHSEVQFSHSICPDCAHELYPQWYKEAVAADGFLDDKLINELEEIGGILATAASEPISRFEKIREALEALGLTAELREAKRLLRETRLDSAGEMISQIITCVAESRRSPQHLEEQSDSQD
jgi:hypothetical protein